MQNVRMIRGLAVAGVSVLLVAGAAFAADGVLKPVGNDRPSLVSSAETPLPSQTAEPTETVEPSQTVAPTETAEPTATTEPAETAKPTDATDAPEATDAPKTAEPTDDHGGHGGSGD